MQHRLFVRLTHWVTVICSAGLLLTGVLISISHPRFYWGETGNVNMEPLFVIPIPASRATVPTGYGYVLPDQNGWSRSLHFEAAWALLFAGLLYVGRGLATRHFQTKLWPVGDWRESLRAHWRGEASAGPEYNALQRFTYLGVVFALFPLLFWTGLAMSPGLVAAYPTLLGAFGGHQSARTLHFGLAGLVVLFVTVHVAMVVKAGFVARTAAMLHGGRAKEDA